MFEITKINLQLFAGAGFSAPYGNPNVNTTRDEGLSVENKTHYDMTLIDEASPYLVHDQFGQKRPIPRNGGKTIEFRKYASIPKATTALTEGVTPDGKTLSVSAITAEVAQYGDYVTLSDVLDLTAIDNNIVEATKQCGRQAGLTLDTITRDILNSVNHAYYCGASSRSSLTAESKLTVKDVKKIVATLKAANAPKINGSYVAIIHPYVAHDLMSDEEWIDAHKYATPENIYEGEIGKIAGVRFVETSEAKIIKDDTCPVDSNGEKLAVFCCLFIAEGAYGVTEITGGGLQTIIKQLGSSGTADPLNQRSSVGWKAMKTAEILVEPYLIRAECCTPWSASIEKSN